MVVTPAPAGRKKLLIRACWGIYITAVTGTSCYPSAGGKRRIPHRRKIMNILDYIPTGHKNAVSRRWLQTTTHMSDRMVRRLIAEVNKNDCDAELIINLQDGKGYFRPAEDEKNLVRNWMAIESSRTAENRMNVDAAKRYLRKDKKPRENELEKNQITMDEWLASLNGGG